MDIAETSDLLLRNKISWGTEKWLQSLSTRAKAWSLINARVNILTDLFTVELMSTMYLLEKRKTVWCFSHIYDPGTFFSGTSTEQHLENNLLVIYEIS